MQDKTTIDSPTFFHEEILWKAAKKECTRRQKIHDRLNTRNLYFKFKNIIYFVLCCGMHQYFHCTSI